MASVDQFSMVQPGVTGTNLALRYVALVGVYHAEGSLMGELRYALGKLRGVAHCALCDITHRGIRKRPEFAALEARLPVPFQLVHLDERGSEIVAVTDQRTPCVVGQTSSGWEVVLDATTLAGCGKDVAAFEAALLAQLRA